ncbi:MAG: hypothetical protein EAZ94_27325 [Oscillatoriales cyanobacterium]|nr:hypothetical protein [Microcoleus sp. PH2017_31_RDM_U_A]MCC3593839.1 hypothetical protein [Microcoleus sp. PH2017_28_MFU_U_A]MCC3595815.1 hypothetical protein [Microcoleus sp. PH2017_26_ELK_O_A]MCC3620214.1 hypothetical protein [Microcoleus sp. PH2017_38_RDM_U_B]MCC3620617.1 hypothetical protein [Microcoleus sp. PH2017_36_ELK_O_B]TAE07837.1 MAG: hypothetical protein EAZ94_27325 [Oscillatoriales cyanobacterium]
MQQFILLPVPMPPMLPQMVRIGDIQYFSIFYQGSKATWSNGKGMGTFSYWGVYAPLLEHPALAIYLEQYNLGSDDEPPESAILCDVGEQKMYVGNCREIDRFLQQQHSENKLPQLTQKDLEEALKTVENLSWEQMQRLGMFQIFGNSNPQARQETAKMVEWLDGYITPDLIQQYVRLAERGNWMAIATLENLKQRILQARKQQADSN